MRTLLLVSPLVMAAACSGGSGRPSGDPVDQLPTLRFVEGQVTYFLRGAMIEGNRDQDGRIVPDQVDFLVPTFPAPAPRIPIEIWTPDGLRLLASSETDSNGRYSVQVDFGRGAPALPVMLRVRAQLNLGFGATVRVIANETSTLPYTHETGPSGNPAEAFMQVNLSITLNEGAGAYHIIDALQEGFVLARSGIQAPFPDVDICWSPDNGTVSRWLGFGENLATLLVAGGIAGDDSSPRDVWDSAVLMRLLGEYLLEYFFHDVAPPGQADDRPLVPSRAWREGFLDYWACAGRGNRLFLDTEGIGAGGRVVRFFDIESFFDPALPPYPNDPNVYQDAANVGICSRFTVAEVMWDLTDPVAPIGDPEHNLDQIAFPFSLTFRALEGLNPAVDYTHLFEVFDALAENAVNVNTLTSLMLRPEDQGELYPADSPWPAPIQDPDAPGPVDHGFDGAVDDAIDTATGNPEVGCDALRFFQFGLVQASNVTVSVDAPQLLVEILDTANTVLSSGVGMAQALDLETARYIVRVSSLATPQQTAFEVRLQVSPPP